MTKSTAPNVYRLVGPYTSGELAGVFETPFDAMLMAHMRAYSGYIAGKRVCHAWEKHGVPIPDGFTTSGGKYGIAPYWGKKPDLDMGLFTKPTRVGDTGMFSSNLRGTTAVKKEFRELWQTLKDIHKREFDQLYGVPVALNDIAGIDLLSNIIGGYSYRLAVDYEARDVYVEVNGAEVTGCTAEPSTYAKFGELRDKRTENEAALTSEVKKRLAEFNPDWAEELK